LAAALLTAQPGVGATDARRAPSHALRVRQAALDRAERRAILDLYAVESRLAAARGALARIRSRAESLAAEHARLRRRTDVVRHSLVVARGRLARMLRSLYKQGQPDPIAILLGAGSIDEAAAGIDDLRRAADSNRRLISQLGHIDERVALLETRLRERGRALQGARRNAELAVARLSGATRDRSVTVASITSRLALTRRQIIRLDLVARTAEHRAATATTRPAAPQRGHRSFVVDAVAYHLPGHTASGLPVGVGVVAVDPAVIPLGTRMFVPGYGDAVAADVGSAVKGYVIDLWMPSRAGALAWGRRSVTITIYR
jgi:3D (Asp-Asp-Asp) domain-containing protein